MYHNTAFCLASTMLLNFANNCSALCTLAVALPSLSTALDIPSSTNGSAASEPDLLSTNTSFLQYDVFPAAIDAKVHCDAQRYGVNLVRSACDSALQKIGTSPNKFTVAQRGLKRRPAIFLPNRWPSGKDPWLLIPNVSNSLLLKACDPNLLTSVIADLKCVIDLTTAPGISSDTTSELEIRQAADRVINDCVGNPGPTSGGSLGNVGASTLLLGYM